MPPNFWRTRRHLFPWLLLPLAFLYTGMVWLCRALTPARRVGVPVICIGNVTLGGTGKTPVTLALGRLLTRKGHKIAVVSRGYGGSIEGPVKVQGQVAAEVGDEPLLLARAVPTYIARKRAEGAAMAVEEGAKLIMLDDGLQHAALHKDLSFVVIDGAVGLGNGFVLPAGPLREPLPCALARVQGVVMIGKDGTGVEEHLHCPLFHATLKSVLPKALKGKPLVAFAGIGRPEKFFTALREAGAKLAATHAFPDHHHYSEAELEALAQEAEGLGATLVTTEKDVMRLTQIWQQKVTAIPAELVWEDEKAMMRFLQERLGL